MGKDPGKRMNIYLKEDIAKILEKVDNTSGYIGRTIRHRWQQWQTSLSVLQSAGWTRAEILASCDAIHGWYRPVMPAIQEVVLQIQESIHLDHLDTKWKADLDHWSGLIKDMDLAVAQSLCVVADEYWIGNTEIKRVIDRIK